MLLSTQIKNAAAIALVGIALLFGACKEDTLLGRDVIPGSDFLNGTFTDTLTLETSTVREDSLRTINLTQYVLGSMQDDVFGNSYAGIYTQFALTSPGIDFNDTAFVDSAVISFTYVGHYGDTNTVHAFRVWRLTEALPDSGVDIYSARDFEREVVSLKDTSGIVAHYNQTYVEGTTTYKPQLRIKLSPTFAQDLLNEDADGAFANQNSFTDYLKGFYIEPDTTLGFGNGMMYVDLRSSTSESALTIYYHTPTTSGKSIRFPTGGAATNSNFFKHNYTGTPVQNALVAGDNDALFIQSLAGVKAKINVPHLQALREQLGGNILVNKAEIEVTQLTPFTDPETQYTVPSTMVVVANDSGENQVILDQLFGTIIAQNYTGDDLPNYGGGKLTITDATGTYTRYKFSVAGELQDMFSQTSTSQGFYLLNFPSNQRAERIVAGSGSRTDAYKLKLNLVYTRIPTQ